MSRTDAPMPPHNAVAVGHQPEHANIRRILVLAVLLVVFAAVVHVVLWVFHGRLRADRPFRPIVPEFADPGPAGHWIDPPADLARLRERESSRLTRYEWIDRGTGTVRIPIERAMEIVAGSATGATTQPAPAAAPGAR